MILSWKNILWFQRVSEHVLELRALRDLRVKGMHYSFWLCGKKKKTYSIHFIIQDAHESILVLFISSYWSVHALVRCRVHWRSHPALCFAKKKKNVYLGEGVALVVRLEIIPRWRCVMYSTKKKEKKSTYQPTVWPVCHLVYSISLFAANFFSVGRRGGGGVRLFDRIRIRQLVRDAFRKEFVFLFFDISHFNSIKHHHMKMLRGTEKHHPAREWCGGSWVLKKKKKSVR